MIAPERNRPLRVLQVVGGLNRGGYETWLLHILKSVSRADVAMDFLVDEDVQYAYTQEIEAAGAKILPCPGYRRPWRYWSNLKKLYAAHGPYDIVHSHFQYRSGFIMVMARRLGVPVRIAHMYPAVDLKPPSLKRFFYKSFWLNATRRDSTHILACSQTSLDAFARQCRGSSQPRKVIWIGIDLSPYAVSVDRQAVRRKLGIPTASTVIAYVARLVPHKNHAQLLRMADAFLSHPAKPHFVFAGSHGSSLEELRQQASGRANVTALIGLQDVSELLLASDAFFFPSLEEGFGIVAVEAAAAGLPVVATDLPTIQEACAPSHRTLMFPPNDDAKAIASLSSLLDCPAQRARLSADGKVWARQFSRQASCDSLIAMYEQSLGICSARNETVCV